MGFDYCFEGQRVLVTGAGKGIGRALADALHYRGAKVYALSRTLEDLKSLKEELPNIVPICVDLADWDATRNALKSLERMDCVINNAAVVEGCEFMSITPKLFDWHLDTNLKAVINVSQVTAAKMMEEGKPGRIVNISSVCGMQALACCGIYGSLKAALEMISRVMAIELGPHKITVNSVNPGHVDTPLRQKCDPEVLKSSEKFFLDRTPTKEVLNPMEDVVNAVLFFASGITSNVTGVSLPVDGGFLIA